MMIDYSILGEAMEFYKSKGYSAVDVPWMVSVEAIYATMPSNGSAISVLGRFGGTYGGLAIASGEQGFIQHMIDGFPKGKYVTCTPCFREEGSYNKTTCPYFMKVELIDIVTRTCPFDMMNVMDDARQFMERYVKTTTVKVSDNQYDLNCAQTGLELGSYGIRQWRDFTWVYGTGVAEPRFSITRLITRPYSLKIEKPLTDELTVLPPNIR